MGKCRKTERYQTTPERVVGIEARRKSRQERPPKKSRSEPQKGAAKAETEGSKDRRTRTLGDVDDRGPEVPHKRNQEDSRSSVKKDAQKDQKENGEERNSARKT